MPFLLLSLLSNTASATQFCASNKANSDDLSVMHIYGKCSPFNNPNPTSSWLTTVMNMAIKDPARLSYLSSLTAQKPKAKTNVPIASGQNVLNTGNYVIRARIGTPGQVMYMVLDTSSDNAWVPCSGCVGCSETVFAPNTSSTFGPVECSVPECSMVNGMSCPTGGSGACNFNQSYGGDSSFSAALSRDALGLGNDVVPDYAFGCINAVSGSKIPPQGLLGLGRGSMSLLSQAGALYSGVFSYCLPSFKSYYFSGSLRLGPVGQPKTIRTTPLLKNPHRPSLYYVNLTGVMTKEFMAPPITFHFQGMDLVLPMENTLIHTSYGNLACLAMAAAPNNVNSVLNVIANLQQQNLRVLFDTINSRLGITHENCN
nr:aspartyl protease AED3-like [Ipomoea batatas]